MNRIGLFSALLLSAALLATNGHTQAPAAAQASAVAKDDVLATTKGNVTIHPIGHAAVLLSWNGKKILVDPAPNGGGGGGRGGAAAGAAAAGGGRGGAGGGGGGRGAPGAPPPPPSPEALAVFTQLG